MAKTKDMENKSSAAVICVGELLVDFMAEGTAPDAGKAERFVKSPGGAMANVAFGLARLGDNSRFVGQVGPDPFGLYLKDVLSKEGVDVRWLSVSDEYPTGLVFVVLDNNKVPKYCFFGNPSADMMLEAKQIGPGLMEGAAFLHSGTVSMVRDPARSTTFDLMRRAKDAGIKISFDPNLRLHLWKDHEQLRQIAKDALRLADVAKLSRDELVFITDCSDLQEGARRVFELGPEIVVVTLGHEGAYYCCSEGEANVPPFKVEVMDTTGAGDGFAAGLLHCLCRANWPLSSPALEDAVRFASAVGALATTGIGAVWSLPDKKRAQDFLESCSEG